MLRKAHFSSQFCGIKPKLSSAIQSWFSQSLPWVPSARWTKVSLSMPNSRRNSRNCLVLKMPSPSAALRCSSSRCRSRAACRKSTKTSNSPMSKSRCSRSFNAFLRIDGPAAAAVAAATAVALKPLRSFGAGAQGLSEAPEEASALAELSSSSAMRNGGAACGPDAPGTSRAINHSKKNTWRSGSWGRSCMSVSIVSNVGRFNSPPSETSNFRNWSTKALRRNDSRRARTRQMRSGRLDSVRTMVRATASCALTSAREWAKWISLSWTSVSSSMSESASRTPRAIFTIVRRTADFSAAVFGKSPRSSKTARISGNSSVPLSSSSYLENADTASLLSLEFSS